MEEHLGIYDNPNGVEFVMDPDGNMYTSSNWPGEQTAEEVVVRLSFDSETIDDFVTAFNLTSVQQLPTITPLDLMELYQQGKAEVFSAIDSGLIFYPLYFRKLKNKMVARDDYDREHEVEVSLETAEQFKTYTKIQYTLFG
jgi:hypothetical protein